MVSLASPLVSTRFYRRAVLDGDALARYVAFSLTVRCVHAAKAAKATACVRIVKALAGFFRPVI
jgi:hypothetical protein